MRRPVPGRATLLALQAGVLVAFFLLWHVLTATGLLDPFFFATPLGVLERTWSDFASGVIYSHLGITLLETLLAFAIGTLGLGIWSKVALGVTLVFFIVFFNVYQGVKEVNPVVLSNARMLGMNGRQLLRHVYLPSALSWVFSSLHTAVGFALVGAVVGEYLGASAGLGYRIAQAEGTFDTVGVFSGMLVLTAFVILIDAVVTRIERRLLHWRPAEAATQSAQA
jgi:NitT/TauT family transport system permease protein